MRDVSFGDIESRRGIVKSLTPKIQYAVSDNHVDAENRHGITLSGRVLKLCDSDKLLMVPDGVDVPAAGTESTSSDSQPFQVVFVDEATIYVMRREANTASEPLEVYNPELARLCIRALGGDAEADTAVLRGDIVCDPGSTVTQYWAEVEIEEFESIILPIESTTERSRPPTEPESGKRFRVRPRRGSDFGVLPLVLWSGGGIEPTINKYPKGLFDRV
jgi:hypothetical protein